MRTQPFLGWPEDESPPQVWLMTPDGALEWSSVLAFTSGGLDPDGLAAISDEIRRRAAAPAPFDRQLRLRRPDGSHRWAQTRTWPVRDPDGQVVRWAGMAVDARPTALRDALLDAISSPEALFGLVLVDPDLRYVRNPYYPSVAFVGRTPEELEGRRLMDVDPALWEQVQSVYEHILAGGGPTMREVSNTIDGVTRHRLNLYYPARIGGELIGIGILDVDITARKRAELAAAQLAEERRELLNALIRTQERERRRIAADIHGDTLQVFAALRLRLEALEAVVDDPGQRAALAELQTAFAQASDRLRTLLFRLWPPSLEHSGLGEAIQELLVRLEFTSSTSTRLEGDLPADLPIELRGVIFRVVAEALTNIRRHAQATEVEIEMTERPGYVLATIRDDGVGFDPSAERYAHVGLREMAQRVEAAGGTLSIDTAPGAGTTISLAIPAR